MVKRQVVAVADMALHGVYIVVANWEDVQVITRRLATGRYTRFEMGLAV
jgi:hypothetical protein